jgi:ubiquinone/menaquinone biosynthesis C-methylase UbiE
MKYDPRDQWTKAIRDHAVHDSYPAQGLIRILRGSFPTLTPFEKHGKALDCGCGDGRNSYFLKNSGYEVTGIEIASGIVNELSLKFPSINFKVGTSGYTGFSKDSFDLVVAWNSIYYMGMDSLLIQDHFKEMLRIIKKDSNSRLVMSIPMPDTFIFNNCEILHTDNEVNYVRITEDPYETRVGETLAQFPSIQVLQHSLETSGWGANVEIGEERGNWFGLTYNWWVIVCTPSL